MEQDELVELDPASRGHLPDAVKDFGRSPPSSLR
jgi:hypothetical protein